MNNNKNKKSLAQIYLNLACPDENGFGKKIYVEDLIKIDEGFTMGNGGSWCRSDGPLREYKIDRIKNGNKIVAVQLIGFNEAPKKRPIRKDIRDSIVKEKCKVLATGNATECDHKNGMYDDDRVGNQLTQKITDFQPLSKHANTAKRKHCNECKEKGIRFDATQLGYSVPYIKGSIERNNDIGCEGCYWFDPFEFNSVISNDFKPVE